MSRKKVKGRTVELGDFLLEGGKPVQAGFVVVQKKIDWADDNNFIPASGLVLPTAPISSRGGHYDDSKVPTEPPFTAYLGNLPFDIGEEEIANFFKDLKLSTIRIAKDSADRPKGFGYAEFEDRASLIGALAFDGDEMRNRTIKVSLPEHEDSRGGFGNRDRMGYGVRGERPPERDLGNDWRSSPREDPPGGRGYDGGPSRGDRYGDRERGGFGDRDRNYGERDREMSRDWRSSEGRGGFENNRSERNYGNRYEPPRDSRDSRDSRNPRSEDTTRGERPKLNLAPRTKPVVPLKGNDEEAPATSPEPPRPKIEKPKASDIFGAAKPVDTAAREREIEAKLAAQAEQAQQERNEKEKREEPEKPQQRLTDNNNESARPPPPRQERSWREESREEKEKRDRKARADRRIPAPQQAIEKEPPVMTSKNKFADLDDVENVQGASENQE